MTDATDLPIGEMLADQLQRLLARAVDAKRLTAIEEGAPITELWQEIEALGVTLALASNDIGADLGWQNCLPMLRTLGWHGAPVPLAESLLASQVLAAAGMDIPAGALAVSHVAFTLDGDNCVSGSDGLVSWLPHCSHLVGVAVRNKQKFLFVVSTTDLPSQPVDSFARIPAAAITLQAQAVAQCAPVAESTDLLASMALLRAAVISGILDRILSLTIEYANTRQQFGRPIGKFQAIQHHVAELAMQSAAAQAGVIFGCQQMDVGNSVSGAAIAKVRASVAATAAASAAHQVFGAIGVTEEHELQLLTRRLWQWRGEAGSDHFWAETLGREVIAAGSHNLWPRITDAQLRA
ncbi:acyl-CoA dehydrogenase [Aestuariicella hydrocarbonica]|uniref:Acyl-CoA dehydrogenase n=1 Tax=Pseudomaricurvus hydrocarbonicus TaxID=1470433 RepID=A0A9E5MM91_9GAMM|nr:acyl-CoA dehydrogenase family protein [Aestuariicella hydrocarbonica]NHO66638.1 acyl-CoA dehydrogenase [Aestuariicella hydrocarbonica]